MAKLIRLWVDSGANIYSKCSETMSVEDLGYTDEEWDAMTEDQKYKVAETWAWENGLEIGYRELEDDDDGGEE